MNVLRKLRRILAPSVESCSYHAASHQAMAAKAYSMVTAFYIVNVFFAYQTMYLLMDSYGQADSPPAAIEPLWPVFFCTSRNLPYVANGLALFYMGASVTAVIWPYLRIPRILTCIAILQALALKYSFGVLNQKEWWWFWASLIFIFLPAKRCNDLLKSRNLRQYYLDIFSIAQLFALLFYSLTGWWKIYYGMQALISHRLSVFSFDGLAYLLAHHMVSSHVYPIGSGYVIAHPLVGWVVELWVVYIEVFSFIIWFRPALHRLWGGMLILFHIGTWLLLGIPFYLQSPLLAILFLQSPFAPVSNSWRQIICQLPLINEGTKLWQWTVRWQGNHGNPK